MLRRLVILHELENIIIDCITSKRHHVPTERLQFKDNYTYLKIILYSHLNSLKYYLKKKSFLL